MENKIIFGLVFLATFSLFIGSSHYVYANGDKSDDSDRCKKGDSLHENEMSFKNKGACISYDADLCKKGGWQHWLRENETPFKNQGACVSYVEKGGMLTSVTTSTTHHETRALVDLPPIENFNTHIQGAFLFDLSSAYITFDVTTSASPTSQEVLSLFDEARQTVIICGEKASQQQGGGIITINGPLLESSSQTSQSVYVREELDHTVTSVTTTKTLGPATIMVGQDQSMAFFVQGGTTNINQNTNTEFFYNDLYQKTINNSDLYWLTGEIAPNPHHC